MKNADLKILLADDDENDRLLFKKTLEELKIKSVVHTVNNGPQSMEYLTKNEADLPHLFFPALTCPAKMGQTV